ncbi:MAG: DNRLRE domain-containing protein, partial [Proteobacteria bacterium]|nr:DNRLRE domain-containing protein [Pseudomonadota bacterium]
MILAAAALAAAVPSMSDPAGAEAFFPAQWAEGTSAKSGATRDYFDSDAYLDWRKLGGDWYDSRGSLYGEDAYAVADIDDQDKQQKITWDVTTLVREWLDGTQRNTGFFLMVLENGGKIEFYSREYRDLAKKPLLRLSYSGSAPVVLTPVADTYLNPSTFKALGTNDLLKTGPILIRFDSAAMGKADSLVKAELVLVTTTKQYGAAKVGVFRPAPELPVAPPGPDDGIAGRYPEDRDIATDKDVIFAEQFESGSWKDSWSDGRQYGFYERVASDMKQQFEKLSGHALRIVVKRGQTAGSAFRYKFGQKTGVEPEAAYFRYYLRLA